MTGDDPAPAPDPLEFLERVLWLAFRQACATMRLHDAVQRRIWGFRYPRVEALGWLPDLGESAEYRRRLTQMDAECAVYVRESAAPWPPTGVGPRGARAADGARLVVAAAVWPRAGLSGLRVARYRWDGALEDVTTEGVRLEDTHLDVPWLRACLPVPVPVPVAAPDPPARRALERWRRAAGARFDWL
ncbi:hypothetical protein ABT084_14870 [Streptomyces sp. NPDC002138]|uniref:hypothetical protein n=1 Tax=Streptomyces sp. NPDC002138 TaxID=3154410 RepID=UPI0033195D6F